MKGSSLKRFGLFLALWMIATNVSISAVAQTTIEGVTITGTDVSQLFKTMQVAAKPNDKTIPIVIEVRSPGDMPAYDRQWHYAGIVQSKSGTQEMRAWISEDLRGDDLKNAIAAAMLIAVSDGGYAGNAFKQLYDTFAAKDAQLPPNAPDPYLYRHKLAAALLAIFNMKK
jgi:hypothetical protein